MAKKTVEILNSNGFTKEQIEVNPVYLLGIKTAEKHSKFALFKHDSEQIENALKDAGCKVKRVDTGWPRNGYVSTPGGRYVNPGFFLDSKALKDFISFAWLGDGGMVASGENFILSALFFPEEYAHVQKDFASDLYSTPVHLVPPLELVEYDDLTHIDLTVGCVPGAKLITVEKRHYDQHEGNFQKLRDKTGYRVVPVDTGNEFDIWGMNYLVVQEQEKTVINNIAATMVNRALMDGGVEVIETKEPLLFPKYLRGSVRCSTNRLDNIYLLEKMELLQYADYVERVSSMHDNLKRAII